MDFLITPRMGGKTTLLVEWLKQHPNAAMVVDNESIKRSIIHDFLDLRWQPELSHRIFTMDQARDGRSLRGFRWDAVAIDNAERILLEFARDFMAPVEIVSASGRLAIGSQLPDINILGSS